MMLTTVPAVCSRVYPVSSTRPGEGWQAGPQVETTGDPKAGRGQLGKTGTSAFLPFCTSLRKIYSIECKKRLEKCKLGEGHVPVCTLLPGLILLD